jgi:SagB-type dehydrogenase family enzyme
MKSACSSAQVELLDPGLARLTTALATPVSVTDALAHRENIGCTAAAEFLGLLEYSGMLTRVERGNRLEDASPLAAWEFVDLLFHNSTRTFVSSQREAPGMRSLPPAVKWPMSADTIDLHVPDIALLEHTDVPLTRVLERRRSGREYGAPIITVEQIGELLYRTARVKKVFAMGERDGRYELTERPYPGAGACYELETYLVVNRCHGLASGLYHYDPLRHRLEAISSDRANLARLNNDAALRTPAAIQRQVLVIIAARFARLAIKYRAGSYGLILKDAGVLLQSMSLVADAMGLASCILGSGDSALFARTAGTQPYEESSVAELLLGSAPPSPAPQSA